MHNHGGHTHNGGSSHNHSGSKNGNGGSNGQNRSNPTTPAKKDLSHVTCYKCQKTGHYANECPEAKNGNDNGSSGKKPNPFNRGQVNRVNVEEVEAQPDAVIGKFLVKSFTALVLFDTGASHSYISRGFVDKYKLPTKVLSTPMLVSSPGAEYMASQGCFQIPLAIGRHVFPSELIILELSRDPVSPRAREDLCITMEATLIMEEVRTTIVAPGTEMVMEEATDITVPTQQHLPRRI